MTVLLRGWGLVGFQCAGDSERDAGPAFGLGIELAAASGGEFVIFGAAVVFSLAPVCGEPALLFHAVERGKERAGFDLEGAASDLFDAARDAETVKLDEGEGFEDEHVERAEEEIGLVGGHGWSCLYRRSLGGKVSWDFWVLYRESIGASLDGSILPRWGAAVLRPYIAPAGRKAGAAYLLAVGFWAPDSAAFRRAS